MFHSHAHIHSKSENASPDKILSKPLNKKTKSNLGVFERLTSKKLCTHDHSNCSHSRNFGNKKSDPRMRRPSRSLNSSPIVKENKKLINFSKLLESTNFEMEERKMGSWISLEKEDIQIQKEVFSEELDQNNHKDYLIWKLCAKLRKLNIENKTLNQRLEIIEKQNSEVLLKNGENYEKIEKEITTIIKEKLENSKEFLQIQKDQLEKSIQQQESESLNENIIQKQEKSKVLSYDDLIHKIKSLENDRNKYYEQLMTVQKKNEVFFIENAEMFKTTQKLQMENENLTSRLKMMETTASLKKKSSPIFKSVFTNESTIETDDEFYKHSPKSSNEEILYEVGFTLKILKNYLLFY